MKKVRGEVNPADLFTKHLGSREKVHQLLALFGCEYREGRAAAAPLLRPMGEQSREGGHSTYDPLPTFSAGNFEAELHDTNRLPHMHSEVEIEKMFPTIVAAAECANSNDWTDGCRDDYKQRQPQRPKCDFGTLPEEHPVTRAGSQRPAAVRNT